MSFAGLILVGGRSRRMGVDKASLPAPSGGGTLLDHQIAKLRAAGADPISLAGRADQVSPRADLGWLTDAAGAPGPLGGLLAGLDACPAEFLAVLAVDLPFFPPELFHRWHETARPGCGWVLRGPKGYEPLAALYPKDALGTLQTGAVAGVVRLQDHMEALVTGGWLRIWTEPLPGVDCLVNWNSLEDMR